MAAAREIPTQLRATVKVCSACDSRRIDLQETDPAFDWSGWAQCANCGSPYDAGSIFARVREAAEKFCGVILVDYDHKKKKLKWCTKDNEQDRDELMEIIDRLSKRAREAPRPGVIPRYQDHDLVVVSHQGQDVVFVVGHARAFYTFAYGLMRKHAATRVEDPVYGGYHLNLVHAEERIARGCPPFELFWPYISPGRRSLLSQKARSELSPLVGRHLKKSGCVQCRLELDAFTIGEKRDPLDFCIGA